MQVYLELLDKVLSHGEKRGDRTGTGTLSVFGPQLEFDLEDGFPLLAARKLHFKSIVHELLWFLKGESNVAYLKENGVSIWDEWADEAGELGPVYGVQWRRWTGEEGQPIDQIARLVQGLRQDPESRRHLVSAWNVAQLNQMALAPCHVMFQFYVSGSDKLSCKVYQRSADLFLGAPFNIASYALLTALVAQVCDYRPAKIILSFGDAHLYLNHLKQTRELLSRAPRPLPRLRLNPAVQELLDFRYSDIELDGYAPHPAIQAPISV